MVLLLLLLQEMMWTTVTVNGGAGGHVASGAVIRETGAVCGAAGCALVLTIREKGAAVHSRSREVTTGWAAVDINWVPGAEVRGSVASRDLRDRRRLAGTFDDGRDEG